MAPRSAQIFPSSDWPLPKLSMHKVRLQGTNEKTAAERLKAGQRLQQPCGARKTEVITQTLSR